MLMENKAVSVVVPVYNREGLVGRCLDSIKAQTYLSSWTTIRLTGVRRL